MSSVPDGAIAPDDWSFDACRERLKEATRIVLDKIKAHDLAAQRSADAEAVYRSEVGKAFAGYREKGDAVEAAKIAAHRDCAKLSRERDYAKDLVRKASADIEAAIDSRRSLWRLVEWARERDLKGGGDGRMP
jgi:hypothetical protein